MNRELETLDLGGWFILRMASSDTLPLVNALRKRGHDVWTPVERRIGRMPRTRKEYDKTLPIMPSYAFASVEAMDDILRLAVIPTSDLPRFTLFRHGLGFPLVADRELDVLRYHERQLQDRFDRYKAGKKKAPTFDIGLEVALSDAGFEGLKGKVVESRGRFTLVDIPGFAQPIRISSLLIAKDVLAGEAKESGAVSKRAA